MINLRSIRLQRGLTLKGLADLVGVSESTISKIETGSRSPSYEVQLRLGEVLDCSVAELIGDSHLPKAAPSSASSISHPEEIMLEAYRELNAEGQRKVYDYILDLINTGMYSKKDRALGLDA